MVNFRESRITWNHLEERLWALFPEKIRRKATPSVSDTVQWGWEPGLDGKANELNTSNHPSLTETRDTELP